MREDNLTGKLAKLGFSKGEIIETIVSTYDSDGHPNAAPMGVTMENARQISIRPYISTLTYKNLQQQKCAVINITSNPELYYRTAFKEVNQSGILPQEFFENAEVVNAPKLRGADAHIEVTVNNISPSENDRATVNCQVKLIKAPKKLPTAYCRAATATIEAIIHATRVKALCSNKNAQEHVQKLLEMIEYCNDVINRVAPTSRYSEIMADLDKRIKRWREESESLR
ncbi:MAG: DUF447 domain-containing protein [Candidatus Bathyarchaeales archaeon]